jgi:hypothetical protein
MANTTITALPSATTPLAGTEVVPIVQGGVTKKVAVSNIGGGSGTVTSVSVATANGLAGSVATSTTTPAITLSTTVTGVLKGNGSAISAATANTDYQSPIALTTVGTSGAATFNGTTLNIPNYTSGGGSGTVTSVGISAPAFLSVGGSPVTSSGTLALTYSGTALPVANGGTGQTSANAALNGLLPSQSGQSGKVLSTDGTNTTWIASGGTGTVTSVALSAPAFLTITGSPITASGTLALSYSGTAIPVANGGTGASTLTGVLKGNGTSAFTAATAGTDYSTGTSALATGIVKSTTGTGALSIAVANTDYQSPITLTTSGSSGAATFVGNTLNIPVYTGGGSSGPILESYQTISSNYSLTAGSNGFSVGPVSVATGVAVTVPTGQVWLIAA